MRYFLLTFFSFLFLQSTAADKDTAFVFTARGDTIIMSSPKVRTVVLKDTVRTIVTEPPRPALLNGKEIFCYKDQPEKLEGLMNTGEYQKFIADYCAIKEILDSVVAIPKKMLPPGDYIIEMKNMVVDEEGRLVYFETEGITRHVYGPTPFTRLQGPPVEKLYSDLINNIVTETMSQIIFTPLIIQGQAIPYLTQDSYHFDVGEEYEHDIEYLIKQLKQKYREK